MYRYERSMGTAMGVPRVQLQAYLNYIYGHISDKASNSVAQLRSMPSYGISR